MLQPALQEYLNKQQRKIMNILRKKRQPYHRKKVERRTQKEVSEGSGRENEERESGCKIQHCILSHESQIAANMEPMKQGECQGGETHLCKAFSLSQQVQQLRDHLLTTSRVNVRLVEHTRLLENKSLLDTIEWREFHCIQELSSQPDQNCIEEQRRKAS